MLMRLKTYASVCALSAHQMTGPRKRNQVTTAGSLRMTMAKLPASSAMLRMVKPMRASAPTLLAAATNGAASAEYSQKWTNSSRPSRVRCPIDVTSQPASAGSIAAKSRRMSAIAASVSAGPCPWTNASAYAVYSPPSPSVRIGDRATSATSTATYSAIDRRAVVNTEVEEA